MTESKDQPEEIAERSMPFLLHLEELRRRLIKSFLAIVVCSGAAFAFADQILGFMKIPLEGIPIRPGDSSRRGCTIVRN